jgi:hypothetical protein
MMDLWCLAISYHLHSLLVHEHGMQPCVANQIIDLDHIKVLGYPPPHHHKHAHEENLEDIDVTF